MDRENESLLRYGCPLLCGESQSQGMEKIFSVSRRDYFKNGFREIDQLRFTCRFGDTGRMEQFVLFCNSGVRIVY